MYEPRLTSAYPSINELLLLLLELLYLLLQVVLFITIPDLSLLKPVHLLFPHHLDQLLWFFKFKSVGFSVDLFFNNRVVVSQLLDMLPLEETILVKWVHILMLDEVKEVVVASQSYSPNRPVENIIIQIDIFLSSQVGEELHHVCVVWLLLELKVLSVVHVLSEFHWAILA
jgi:hypothetical protein